MKKPKTGKAPIPAPDLTYARVLVKRARTLRALVLPRLLQIIARANRERQDRADAEPTAGDLIAELLRVLSVSESVYEDRAKPDPDVVTKIVGAVDKHVTRDVVRSVGEKIGERLLTVNPFDSGAASGKVSTWIGDNVSMITSLDRSTFDDLRTLIETGARDGMRSSTLADKIQEQFDTSEERAKLIARDQIATLNANITEEKHKALGITRYKWSTSGDSRVRGNPAGKYPNSSGDHFHLDGEIYSYDDPPVVDPTDGRTANPGEDYNCRCVAIPVIDDDDEAANDAA